MRDLCWVLHKELLWQHQAQDLPSVNLRPSKSSRPVPKFPHTTRILWNADLLHSQLLKPPIPVAVGCAEPGISRAWLTQHLRYSRVWQQLWTSRRCSHCCPAHRFLLPAPCASSGQRCRCWHWLRRRKAGGSAPVSPHWQLLCALTALQISFPQSAEEIR